MKRVWRTLEDKLNNYSIRKKLLLFYFCCVLVPLFITDSVILSILYSGEVKERSHEMANIASAVEAELIYTFEEAAKMVNAIYLNRSVYEFLEQEYATDLEFFMAGRQIEAKNFYEVGIGTGSTNIVMYADNETIVNGNHFYRLSTVESEDWCRKLMESDRDIVIQFYYIGESNPSAAISRKISVMRKLNYYKDLKSEKLVRIDLDYSTMVRKLVNMKYNMPVYVCSGDKIIYSNVGYSGTKADFDYLTGEEKIGYTREFTVYREPIRILIMETESDLFEIIRQHMPLILLMLAVNVLLPFVLAVIFNRSLVSRLAELSNAFDEVEAESLKEIEKVRGTDEIGSLMHNYNRMVRRSRELIKTVYRDRLEKQKMDIARQNAELLALHSQINPHFLFNVLESIRMHSVIKGEEETAGMIERLAVLERQNVEWKSDMIRLREELKCISAYLELQKYRFGERLWYQLETEEECLDYVLPRLTLSTFVENACVHGVEKKATACWIYVRVYCKNSWLYLEVEDTGDGMDENKVEELRERMKVSSIEAVKYNEHVGIANACLRLKMVTGQKAEFELESEQGVGTFMLIKVPIACLQTDKRKG